METDGFEIIPTVGIRIVVPNSKVQQFGVLDFGVRMAICLSVGNVVGPMDE